MTESSPGAVLPETPEAKSGCVMNEISLSDMAVMGRHRERGAPHPCATQGHHWAELVKLQLGKASHKADCCCLLTIATAQTCSRAVAEALGPLRCSTQPTAQLAGAAEQLFPAVVTGLQPWQGLWVTRCILTSSCALAKALYPQAKTPTLAISKSNITVTIIMFKQFCCCCCCYEHRSSIRLS